MEDLVKQLMVELKDREAKRDKERQSYEAKLEKQNAQILQLVETLTKKDEVKAAGGDTGAAPLAVRFKLPLTIDESRHDNVARWFVQLEADSRYAAATNEAKRDVIYQGLSPAQFGTLDNRLKQAGKATGSSDVSDVKQALLDLFDQKLSLVRRRERVFRAEWKGPENETPALFMSRVRGLIEDFDFTSFNEDALTNMVIFLALKDPMFEALRIRLLEKLNDKPDMDQTTIEGILTDFYANLEDQRVPEERLAPRVVNRVHMNESGYIKNGPNKENSRPEEAECPRCGFNDHDADSCRHARSLCYNCDERGHLSRVCKRKKPSRYQSHSVRVGKVSLVAADTNVIPERLHVPMMVNGCPISMEYDTGSDVSILSHDDYDRLGSPRMVKAPMICDAVGNEKFQLDGCIMVQMSSSEMRIQRCKLHVAAVNDSIMGRDVMKQFGLLPPDIWYGSNRRKTRHDNVFDDSSDGNPNEMDAMAADATDDGLDEKLNSQTNEATMKMTDCDEDADSKGERITAGYTIKTTTPTKDDSLPDTVRKTLDIQTPMKEDGDTMPPRAPIFAVHEGGVKQMATTMNDDSVQDERHDGINSMNDDSVQAERHDGTNSTGRKKKKKKKSKKAPTDML